MKKIISLILAAVMLVSLLSVSAFAEDGISWNVKDGVLTVDGECAIPDSIFEYRNDFHTVVINEGITGIGTYSFASCGNLETVYLPSSLKSISTYAFYNSGSLSEIEIPSTVNVNSYAFFNCYNLSAILHRTKDTQIGYGAFYQIKKLTVMVPAGWSGDTDSFDARSSEYITDTPTGSTISGGNGWIIGIGAAVILGGIAAVVIAKKKKKV